MSPAARAQGWQPALGRPGGLLCAGRRRGDRLARRIPAESGFTAARRPTPGAGLDARAPKPETARGWIRRRTTHRPPRDSAAAARAGNRTTRLGTWRDRARRRRLQRAPRNWRDGTPPPTGAGRDTSVESNDDVEISYASFRESPMNRAPSRSRLDVAGGVVAGVCAVHCVVMPMLIAFGGLGLLGAVVSERLEVVFVATSLVIGLASLGPAFLREHRDPVPLLLFAVGFGALAVVRLFHAPPLAERCIVPLCGVLLIGAHARNHRACSHCRVCDGLDPASSGCDVASGGRG